MKSNETGKSPKSALRRIWEESAGIRLLTSASALVGCGSVAAALLFVWITKSIVDEATAPTHSVSWLPVASLIACLLMQLLLTAARRRIETVAYTKYVSSMRRRLLHHLLCTRWNGRSAMPTGDAISRMQDDVATLASLTCSTVPGMVSVCLQLSGAFIFLAILDLRLAAAIVMIMPLALLASKIYIKKTRQLTTEIREHESGMHSYLQESLRHRTLLSTLMGADTRTDRYDSLQSKLTDKLLRRTNISIFSNTAVSAGFMAGYTVTFLWCAYGLAAGIVSFGMMTAFLQLVSQVQRPVVDLSRRIPTFISSSVAMERVDGILSQPIENYSAQPPVPGHAAGLRLTHVSYRYPDGDRDVICDLTHDFRPGSVTCITGATGVGKSTLLRILLGLIEPSAGYAEIYSASGTSSPITPGVRRSIVYVPQGNTLMHGTVRENLLLARPDATEQEMRKALETAAAGFVLDLPDGLDTPCFEGGSGFSEGQAQRIAIARGLLKPGCILLLDEPTSSLDNATELELLARLREHLPASCTAIIVTHRKAALDYCTDVLEMTRTLC
ncbi:MAG: ABC transporter ATP-binding protein/permease [Muribaculaceae bacterium]|nr:ABC transporter ATP-binding protein/permease [Muribaculaceae bacterium]